MPTSQCSGNAMAAGLIRSLASNTRRNAIAGSVALHGAILYALAGEAWLTEPPALAMDAQLVFVSPTIRPPVPLPDDLTGPEAPEAIEPLPETLPDTPPVPETIPEPEPIAEDVVPEAPPGSRQGPDRDAGESAEQARAAERVEPSSVTEAPDRPSEAPESSEEVEPREDRPAVDYTEAGRQAVRAYLDRVEREQNQRRFGGDELIGERRSDDGAPARSVFESNRNSSAVLRPTKARSRLVRRIAQLCNSLTGGISVFGLVGLCTDGNVRSDLFAAVKPAYLDEVPECEAVELAAEGQAIVATGDFGATAAIADIDSDGIATAIKCRLVSADERYRGDDPPELAE